MQKDSCILYTTKNPFEFNCAQPHFSSDENYSLLHISGTIIVPLNVLASLNIITPKLVNESTFGRVNKMRSCDLTMNAVAIHSK